MIKVPDHIVRQARRMNIDVDAIGLVWDRDQTCVYCRETFVQRTGKARFGMATIEHMATGAEGTTDPLGTLAICCHSCNASRKPPHAQWFETKYCLERNINFETVAEPVQDFLTRPAA